MSSKRSLNKGPFLYLSKRIHMLPSSVKSFLAEPYTLTQEQIEFYQEYRFIKLKQVLNDESLQYFNTAIAERVVQMNKVTTELEERSTYGKAFLQLFNLWSEDQVVKELVFSKRLAKIATDLMQTKGVRIIPRPGVV